MEPIAGLPEAMLRMAKAGWESYLQLHRQFLEAHGITRDRTEGPPFERIGEELAKAWMEAYEKEFRQYLTLPQLGLTRYYQERMGEVLDKFNLFQVKMARFISLLYQPIEKSFQTMQGELRELKAKGQLSQDPKDHYQMWIKTLERYYMALFKSPEYVEVMKNALEAVEEFALSKEKYFQGFLQLSSIPSFREIDDLSKEVYELKKKVRALAKRKGERPVVLRPHVRSDRGALSSGTPAAGSSAGC